MPEKDKDSRGQSGPPPDGSQNHQPTTKNANGDKENSSSLASRIQNSASTLIRDAVTKPSGHTLGSDLAQVLDDGGKPGSSRWPGHRLGGSSASPVMDHFSASMDGGMGSISTTSRDGVSSSATESFRSSRAPIQDGFDLDAIGQEQFQNQYGNDILIEHSGQSQFQSDRKGKGKGKGKGREIEQDADLSPSAMHRAWEAASLPSTSRQAIQSIPGAPHPLENTEDGAAVVALLSDPTFQPEFLPMEDDPIDYSAIDAVAPLTAEELQIIDSFRRNPLYMQGAGRPGESHPRPITSQSLIPDIDGFLAQDGSRNAAVDGNTLRDRVLASLPGAEDWIGVDDRYQEEVWGYLRPALEAASKELEEMKEQPRNASIKDGPAVQRLRMILRHMQQ